MLKPEQAQTVREGHIAPIFLTNEPRTDEIDLFSYSEDFLAQHKEILPEGFGKVSGLLLPLDYRGELLEAREIIAFDARKSEEGNFVWELCVAREDLEGQRVIRLDVSDQGTTGIFARTDIQGALYTIFELEAGEVAAIEAHLLSRLEANDVQEQILQVHQERQRAESDIDRKEEERKAAHRAYELRLKGFEYFDRSLEIADEIQRRKEQLAKVGFTALTLFREGWLKSVTTVNN